MPSLVYFEVTADDLERAVEFYRDVFGWELTREDGDDEYYMIDAGTGDGPGITGGVVPRFNAYESTVNTFDVDDVDAFARKITEAGGEVLAPKVTIPGVGFIQYCQDTEGNTFGVMQFDEAAS